MKGLLSRAEAAQFVGLAPQTLAIMAIRGGGPRLVKLGRRVLYDETDLREWIEGRKFASTSEYPDDRRRSMSSSGDTAQT